MTALAAVTATVLASSGGDRGIKAIIFWGLIVLIIGGIVFAVRRSRAKRNDQSAPDDWDDWHPGSGQTGHDGRSS